MIVFFWKENEKQINSYSIGELKDSESKFVHLLLLCLSVCALEYQYFVIVKVKLFLFNLQNTLATIFVGKQQLIEGVQIDNYGLKGNERAC